MKGRFFKVIHAEQQTFDVVCVRENGSLACSCGRFATFGAPDRHIFSVFRHGFFAFNSILHLHPIYLRPSAVSLNPKEVLNQSWSYLPVANCRQEKIGNVTRPDDTCSWDFVIQLTEAAWNEKGRGGIGAQEPLEVESEQETRRQRIKKHLIKLENIAMKDSRAENEITDLLKKYLSISQENAGKEAKKKLLTRTAVQVESDRRKKRAVSAADMRQKH